MKLSVGRKITLGFGSSVLALSCIGWLSYRTIVKLAETESQVAHSAEILAAIESEIATLADIELAQRGYLLTGDEELLKNCIDASTKAEGGIAALRRLTAGNPEQQRRVSDLDSLVQKRLVSLRNGIQFHGQQGGPTVVNATVVRWESDVMEQIRLETAAMRNAENKLLTDREQAAQAAARTSKAVIWSGSAFACALGLVALMIIRGDLRQRDESQEALKQSEERLRLMIEAVKDYAIIMLDPAGRIVSWNAGSQRIKGYTAEEIIGQRFSRFYPDEIARSGFPEKALASAVAGDRFESEGWRVRKDGSRFWADVVITAVKDSSGKLLGFVKVTRDLTERRETERKLQELNEDLQRRANQLQVANSELEAFSYSVSHDLRAPLRHINGYVNLLRKSVEASLDEKARHYLHVISDSARQMGLLIDDLLVFSRMGRSEMHRLEVNLEALIQQIVHELQTGTADRKITWRTGQLPVVKGDPAMLRQVWVNLLGNAVKYTRTRETAEIEIGCSETRNEYVIFVRDNGVGFDMNYAHKLFGVFQRLHGSDEFEGTGIGLAIARRIINRHGGRTWAEGKVNGGATFYCSLPRNQEENS